MSIQTMQFRTTLSKPSGVDTAARKISGVVVMELGKIKDYRGYHLDQAFADALMKSAKKQSKGVMSNFGHNWDNLGKRLGRMNNFSMEGDKVIADLYVFESADKSPAYPGMGSYVLEMANEDAEAIMLSINFSYKYQYQKMKDGTEFKCNYLDKETYTYVYPNPALGYVYLKFDELASVDAVDKGAATNQFFADKGELIETAYSVLGHEQFSEILAELPVELQAKMKKPGIVSEIKALFGLGKSHDRDADLLIENGELKMENDQLENEKLAALNDEITTLQSQLSALTAERDQLSSAKESLESTNTALSAQVSTLETSVKDALSRIEALEKSSAAAHSNGDEAAEGTEDIPLYLKNPINAKFAQKYKGN